MQLRHEAHIAGSGIAVPCTVSTETFLQVDAKMRRANGQSEQTIHRLASFSRGTGINTRHYAHPHWLADDPSPVRPVPDGALEQDIFTIHNFVPPYHDRMKVFGETCVKLGIAAARKAIDDWGGDPSTVTHILTTCTSGWAEPGVAVGVMQALGLPHDCAKAELNFNGCFCGATCLRLARDIVRAGDEARVVLVVAVEVASTHYDVHATDLSSLVAHSLFADGAAAMVVATEGRWRYGMSGMSLVPESSHLLGLVPPLAADHQSYRMHLDKRTGQQLGEYFRTGAGKELLDRLHCGQRAHYPALAIHPGGPNILDNVQEAVLARGWPEGAMQSSYDTLQGYGNLGAAAMLFVLANRLADIEDDELITMAFGPGVTVEWAKLARA